MAASRLRSNRLFTGSRQQCPGRVECRLAGLMAGRRDEHVGQSARSEPALLAAGTRRDTLAAWILTMTGGFSNTPEPASNWRGQAGGGVLRASGHRMGSSGCPGRTGCGRRHTCRCFSRADPGSRSSSIRVEFREARTVVWSAFHIGGRMPDTWDGCCHPGASFLSAPRALPAAIIPAARQKAQRSGSRLPTRTWACRSRDVYVKSSPQPPQTRVVSCMSIMLAP